MVENAAKSKTILPKILLCVLFMLLLICFPSLGVEGVRAGLDVCYNSLIPSLFPFMLVCASLTALLNQLKPKNPIVPVAAAVTLGLVGGFPVGAATLSRLTQNGTISKKRAALLLTGCVNAGPAYLLGAVGLGVFGNAGIGLLLLISLCFASLVCIFLSMVFFRSEGASAAPVSAAAPFTLGDGIRQSVRAMSALCGYVVLFSCVSAFLSRALETVGANTAVVWLMRAVVEVTGGCAAAGCMPGTAGALLACAGVSLCSASVLLQVRTQLEPAGISMRYFLLSRPLHCALSVGMMKLLLLRFERVVSVMAGAYAPDASLFILSPLFSLAAFFLCFTSLFGDRRGFGFTKR